jgi:ribonucleoside-triphosphate reductase
MCCRLQLSIKELKQLKNKTGGLFGAGELTGSVGVVTVNMPKIGFLSKKEGESDFFARLEQLMILAKDSLEIKRKEVQKNMDQGLLPYTKRYLGNLDNHFATIGLLGMHEACLNFLGPDFGIQTNEGKNFSLKVLDFMREKLQEFQTETGHLYNLEATPGEGTSYRFAKHDKKNHSGIIHSGKDVPFYTNSSQLPVDYTEDIFEALDHQDELQCKYTGGTVLHGFLGERISSSEACKKLVKKIASNYKLPYFTITPTFSVCKKHGYIAGSHEKCPAVVRSSAQKQSIEASARI